MVGFAAGARAALIVSLMLGGCATKRAAHLGMAAGGAVILAGYATVHVSIRSGGWCDPSECVGQSGSLAGIAVMAAGFVTLAVAFREARAFDVPSPAERAAMVIDEGQRAALAGRCEEVESIRREITSLPDARQFVVRYDGTPSIERCMTRMQRRRNQEIAWDVTKLVSQTARQGDCAGAIAAAPQVMALDAEFHRVVYMRDAAIRACLDGAPARTRSTVEVLTRTAVQRAKANDCSTVRVIAARVRDVDAKYHDDVFAREPALLVCLAP